MSVKTGIFGVLLLGGISFAAWQAGGVIGSGDQTNTPAFVINRPPESVYDTIAVMPLPKSMLDFQQLDAALPGFDIVRDKKAGKYSGLRIMFQGKPYLDVRAELTPEGSDSTKVNVKVDLPDSAFSLSNELKTGDITMLGNMIDAYTTAWIQAKLNGEGFDEKSFFKSYERNRTEFEKEYFKGWGRRINSAAEDVLKDHLDVLENWHGRSRYNYSGSSPEAAEHEFQMESQRSQYSATKPMTNLPGY